MERDMFGARKGEYEMPIRSELGQCKSCGAGIVWIETERGKAMPLSIATIEERDGFKFALSF